MIPAVSEMPENVGNGLSHFENRFDFERSNECDATFLGRPSVVHPQASYRLRIAIILCDEANAYIGRVDVAKRLLLPFIRQTIVPVYRFFKLSFQFSRRPTLLCDISPPGPKLSARKSPTDLYVRYCCVKLYMILIRGPRYEAHISKASQSRRSRSRQ